MRIVAKVVLQTKRRKQHVRSVLRDPSRSSRGASSACHAKRESIKARPVALLARTAQPANLPTRRVPLLAKNARLGSTRRKKAR